MLHVVRAFALAAGLGLLAASSAHASCANPRYSLIGSYPTDGATDVPTDAQFLVAAIGANTCRVTFNGTTTALSSGPLWHLPLGALSPQHDYVLTLDCSAESDAGLAPKVIHFRTGDGPGAAPPASVTVKDYEVTVADQPAPQCNELLATLSCFDTGDPYDVQFTLGADAGDDDVFGWSIDGRLWPVSCGPLRYRLMAPAGHCFQIAAVSATGTAAMPTEYCLPEHLTTGEPKSGCNLGIRANHASVALLLTCAALLAARRRSQRRA